MGAEKRKTSWDDVLALARRQHGAVALRQLQALDFSDKAVKHAVAIRRLHATDSRAVYAVGRRELDRLGRLSAALLATGDDSVLVDEHAGALWRIWRPRDRVIHVNVPPGDGHRSRDGVVVHHRRLQPGEVTRNFSLRVTSPVRTIIDLSVGRDERTVERLINDADARNVLRADTLRAELDRRRGQPGVPVLTSILDRDSFVLTDSELERLFVPLAIEAGRPKPRSQQRFGPHRVDFFFAELNLVVECDSLRYHRTAQQQAEDIARDHAHVKAEREWIRFTHHQIAHDPAYVVAMLGALVARMRGYTERR
jgi:very-short-patch-repair endonuclease